MVLGIILKMAVHDKVDFIMYSYLGKPLFSASAIHSSEYPYNGNMVNQHFGMSESFVIVTIEDKDVICNHHGEHHHQ